MANEIYFYQPDFSINDDQIILTGDEHNHLSRVLRLTTGDEVYVTNGLGLAVRTMIGKMDKKESQLVIEQRFPEQNEMPVAVTLGVGLIKPAHWEWLIEKVTELGVMRIVPLLSSYTTVRHFRPERSEKIITAAIKQSCRSRRPILESLTSFESFVASDDARMKLVFDKQENSDSIYSRLSGKLPEKISVLIGPEGGFSESEVDFAVKNGYLLTLLGTRRLRTETAAVSALSNIVSSVEGVNK